MATLPLARLALPMLLLSTAACDSVLVCTEELRLGVTVTVRDAVTEQPVLSGVRGALHEGSFVDSLWVITDIEGNIASLVGAAERAGTYRIELVAEGYHPWSRDGVVVTADECHVNPVAVQADMVPLGER